MSVMTPAHEAISLLIDLAQKGEINPWDVQVIDVIDRYLSELGITEEQEIENQYAHLPQSGQAFLWASMLVLLKADTLQRLQEVEESEIDLVEDDWSAEDSPRSLPLRLEQHIRRRPTAPPPRKRRVTLPELIAQLEEIASVFEGKSPSKRISKPRLQSRSEATRIVTELAHNENLTEIATQLDQFLHGNWSKMASEKDWVNWEKLLDLWGQLQIGNHHNLSDLSAEDNTKDRVGIFWALLLLSSQSKVELFQAEFYQDLSIKPLVPEDVPALMETS